MKQIIKPGQDTLHLAMLTLCRDTSTITALYFEIHMIWSILSKVGEQKPAKKQKTNKPPLHIQISIMQCWHLRVLDLKAFKWTWLWCKNIIAQFCQTHRHKHMHQHAHRRPPCKLNMHRASTALTIWFITAAKTCFWRSLFTQICRRVQLEAISVLQKSNVVGLAIPKCIF